MSDLNIAQESWDADTQSFGKRAHAKLVANALWAAGFAPKGVTIDKDGARFRVYLPALSVMWWPAHDDWHDEVAQLARSLEA